MGNLKCLYHKLRKLIFLLEKKGLKYTYNYFHFYIFWDWIRKRPFLIKLINLLASYPSYIEIEVTTRCDLKCIICEHTYWAEPNRDMSFEEFKGVVDQFPKLKWIGLTGIGESFLNRDFMRMLKFVKSKNILLELYDSFYFIDEDIGRELIELGIDKIFASIDAATKETYEKIRVGSDFDRVIKNVKTFFQLKKQVRAYFPEISFHYIVNKLNFHQIPQYIELVHSLNPAEEVTIQFTRMLHKFKEIEDLFTEIPYKIIQLAEDKAKKFNIRVSWSLDVPHIKPPIKNCIEWTMPFIFATGDVIPCCAGNEAGERALQKETALGNVFGQGFKEIWYGKRYKVLRKTLRHGKVPLQCKNCCIYRKDRI